MRTAGRPRSRWVLRAARVLRTSPEKIYTLRGLAITSLVVALAIFGARKIQLLRGAEDWWLDLMAKADRSSFDVPIVVVGINDRDYYDPSLFGGTSPLAPDALGRVVESIVSHKPRGLVLDILIHPSPGESPERVAARERLYKLLIDASEQLPIVLARDLISESVERTADGRGWQAFDALTRSPKITCASAAIRESRGYVRAVPLKYEDEDPHIGGLPTLLGAAVSAMGLKAERSSPWPFGDHYKDPAQPWRIRFSKCFLETSTTVTPHYVNSASLLTQQVVPGARSMLANQIVLVGGTFHAGRDILPTVVGDMAGVYIWAEAIASWMRDDALREPLEFVAFLLEFLVGVLAGYLLVQMGPFLGLVTSLGIVGPLTIFFSLLTFGDHVLFLNFLPSFFGVYLHYQIDIHRELRRLKAEVARLSSSDSHSQQAVVTKPPGG